MRLQTKWKYVLLYGLLFLVNMFPLITEKPYLPQDTQDVIINLLMVSIKPYQAYAPIFHIATLLILFAILWKPGKMGRLVAGYFGVNYLVIGAAQTMGQTEKYGFVIQLSALVTMLFLGITWLVVAFRNDLQPRFRRPTLPEYGLIALALMAFWGPYTETDSMIRPDFNPLLLLTSPDYGLAFCFTTPVFLLGLIFFYPHVNGFAYRGTAFSGLLYGLFNLTHWFNPATLWMGFLHLPLLIISIYALILPRLKNIKFSLLTFTLVIAACAGTETAQPTPSLPAPTQALPLPERILLTADALANGFEFDSPLDESALTPPADAAPATHIFEGRLELLGEKENGQIKVLRGQMGSEYASLPEFNFEFVQDDGYLIPAQRGLIIGDHPIWNIILEPGRVWQEAGDGGFARASLPFALTVKGGNATFNGVLTFLFDDQRVSKVWYQVTQETTTYSRADLWGLLEASYYPGVVNRSERIRADFATELSASMPVKPIEALADAYPGVDVSAFGGGVTREHMTWYGLTVNGVNYIGGCQTRFGLYPYCEAMRATSYSTAKSAFVSLALMRMAQKYGLEVVDLLIKDYVPEHAASAGDWEQVTFNNTLDMATGNYDSAGFMVDDESNKMGVFFGAQPYAERIKAAFSAPHQTDPGTRWVYRTSDTFILTRALQNYLQTKEDSHADIYQFVVDEVYRPLRLGPGAFTSMRTADNDWQGQAEGGFGQWWIPDDIAKIGTFLIHEGGKINGEQILHPDLLAASLQQNPDDRGVQIDSQRMYNNSFWANRYTTANGFECEFWVVQMLGVSGNVVALFPNGVTYYYFSDNQEFTWDEALRESQKIIPLCP